MSSKFKNTIKTCVPDQCPCRICSDYIAGVGYVNIYEWNTSHSYKFQIL